MKNGEKLCMWRVKRGRRALIIRKRKRKEMQRCPFWDTYIRECVRAQIIASTSRISFT